MAYYSICPFFLKYDFKYDFKYDSYTSMCHRIP